MSHDREARKKSKSNLERTLKQKWRRYSHLRDEARNLGKVTLEEPIRHGWNRSFILNEQTKNRNDAREIQQVLDLVNNTYWSRERDWSSIEIQWKGMRHINECQLHPLTGKEYNKLPTNLQKYFMRDILTYSMGIGRDNTPRHYYVIDKPNMYFRLKDKKCWITEVPIFDPQLDKEIDEIWNWIEWNGLYGKLANCSGWRLNYWDDWNKKQGLVKMKKNEIREYFDDLLNQEYEYKQFSKKYGFNDERKS